MKHILISLILFQIFWHINFIICSFEKNVEWLKWKNDYSKLYENSNEEKNRFNIFQLNLAKIQKHNLEYNAGLHTYWLGINQFADMTWNEFEDKYLISNMTNAIERFKNKNLVNDFQPDDNSVPDEFDWRDQDAVTSIKDQLNCSSSWAFSIIGVIEGQYCVKALECVNFSVQQLIDCSTSDGNHGCAGGHPYNALDYILNMGIESNESYPYEAVTGKCRYNRSKSLVSILMASYLSNRTEDFMKVRIYNYGPISVCIESIDSFRFYQGGIYSSKMCNSGKLNHAALLVGYGNTNSTDFWIAKNSWGTNWGEKGYFRILRNENMCNITRFVSAVKLNTPF